MTRTPFGLVLLLFAAGLGAAGQFAKISVLFDLIALRYPEAGTALGWLVSLLSLLGIVFGLLAGLVAARIGFRRLLLAALILGAALSVIEAGLPPLPLFLALRLIEGASHLAIVVAAPTLIAQISAARDLPVTMTLWSTFFGVAFAVTAWVGRPVALDSGPGAVFLAHGAYMAVIAGLVAWRLPGGEAPGTTPLRFGAVLARHRAAYASPRIAAPALGWLFYTLTNVSLITVLPGRLPMEARDWVTGALPLAGLISSMTLGNLALRRFSPIAVVVAGFALAGVLALWLMVQPGAPWIALALLAALGLVQGGSFAAVPALNADAEDRALANGALAQMGNLGNTLGTPLLLLAAQRLGDAGLGAAVGLACGAAIVVHLALAQARRRVPSG
ncbi:MAG: MFS transporter [Pararhodobacter sp.]